MDNHLFVFTLRWREIWNTYQRNVQQREKQGVTELENINPKENEFEEHQELCKYKTESNGDKSSEKSTKNYKKTTN